MVVVISLPWYHIGQRDNIDIVEHMLMHSYSDYTHSSGTTDCRRFDVESAFLYIVPILIDFCLMIIAPSG